MIRRILLPLAALLLPGGAALATRVAVVSASCPLDGTSIKVFRKVSSNDLGGWDSDLADYSTRGQWREFAISTCPEDLFTVYGSDAGLELDSATAERVRGRLAEAREGLPAAGDLEVWDRYLLAAAVYEALGRDHLFLGQLYLQASWTARDAAIGPYQDQPIQGPRAARELLDRGREELGKPLDAATRSRLLFNLARVAERGGFTAEREALLAELERGGGLKPAERDAVARFRHLTGEVEPRLQALAIAEFRAALGGLSGPGRARPAYIIADLQRRAGHLAQAAAGYARLAAMPGAPQRLVELSGWLREEIRREGG